MPRVDGGISDQCVMSLEAGKTTQIPTTVYQIIRHMTGSHFLV